MWLHSEAATGFASLTKSSAILSFLGAHTTSTVFLVALLLLVWVTVFVVKPSKVTESASEYVGPEGDDVGSYQLYRDSFDLGRSLNERAGYGRAYQDYAARSGKRRGWQHGYRRPRRIAPSPKPKHHFVSLMATLVLLGIVAVLVAWAVWHAAPWVINQFLRHNFSASFISVFIVMATTLRVAVLRAMSWRRLKELWLSMPGISSVLATAGFGGLSFKNVAGSLGLRALRLDLSELPAGALIACFLAVVALFGFAHLMSRVGRALTDDDRSHNPIAYFAPAYGSAWIANLGAFALFFNGLLITVYTYLSTN
jgi:hypothetical protein